MTRIGIVYPHANLDTVPSLIGAAEILAERGYDVDVHTYAHAGQVAPTFTSPRVRVRLLGVDGLVDHSTAGLRRLVKRLGWLPDAARARLGRGYAVLGAGLSHGSRLASRARGVADRAWPSERYACVIGVDADGLALADSLAQGAPLGYYSLELLLSYELRTPVEGRLKQQERELSRQAAFVVVQDEARARLLAEDNGIGWERLVLVPNSPCGPARRQRCDYWHNRFGLPDDARVALHAGSVGEWTGIGAIVDSVADWPQPWVLVVHTRHEAESSSYVEELQRRSDPRRVLFSLRPVPHQEYEPLLDGGDVGVGFYVPTGESSFTGLNIQTIGLSSGKLAYYLRSGLPVIVNRAASIASLVDSSGCGVSVEDARGIGAALSRISGEYARFSANACAVFDNQVDFRRSFEEVVERVDRLARAS